MSGPQPAPVKLSLQSIFFHLPHTEHFKSLHTLLAAGHLLPFSLSCEVIPRHCRVLEKKNKKNLKNPFFHLYMYQRFVTQHKNKDNRQTLISATLDYFHRLTLTTSPPSTFISWRRFCCKRLVLERHFSKPSRSTGKKRKKTTVIIIKHSIKFILPMVMKCKGT